MTDTRHRTVDILLGEDVVAVSGGPIPVLDLDAGFSARQFEDMLGRRMSEIAAHPTPGRRLTYSEHAALERALGWEASSVAEDRREFEARVENQRDQAQREIGKIIARRPEVKAALLGRSVDGVTTCPTCKEKNRADSRYCTSCGNQLEPLETFQGEQSGDTDACSQCGRMNEAGSAYCSGCGRPMLTAAPVIPQQMDQASSRPRGAVSSRSTRFVAIKSFRFRNPHTHLVETVKAGVSYSTREGVAYQVDPTAWAVAS
jgi:hypothetical protein